MHWYVIIFFLTLNLKAQDFQTTFNKGIKAFNTQAYEQAANYFEQANTISQNQPEVLYNLASCYRRINKVDKAISLLHRTITLKPDYIKAYHLLITLLKSQNKKDDIEKLYQQLLVYEPNNIQAHSELARYYKEKELFEEAIDYFQKALEIDPSQKNILFELALVYTLIGQTKKSIELYDHILKYNPRLVSIIYNKGYCYKMEGNAQKAITCYKKALELDAHYDAAHFALGMAHLIKGDFEHGWQQHARYLKKVGRNGDKMRQYLAKGNTHGKRILLRPEGGLGDSINFIRYARELKRYGFYVMVAIQKPLYNLFKNCDYIDKLIPTGQAMPPFDDHTTLMSIPAILYSHTHKLPTFAPYVKPDPERVAYWQDYLKHDTNFKIGICWESSVHNDASRPPVARRGMPLELMYILSELNNVSLYSLQQHDGVEQLQDIPPYFKIHTFDAHFDKTYGSFVDTAAVMHHMDLIISVDTAIPHLAGALGKPVWLLLPWATDWRWLEHQTTSPWYPTMRIFKQPTPFDWQSVMNEVYWELLRKTS